MSGQDLNPLSKSPYPSATNTFTMYTAYGGESDALSVN